jgi:hypothetical protein
MKNFGLGGRRSRKKTKSKNLMTLSLSNRDPTAAWLEFLFIKHRTSVWNSVHTITLQII